MILVDTSAWIEYLRATGTLAHHRVRSLLEQGEALATTEVVVMELLAGARDEAQRRDLRRLLLRCEMLPLNGLADYESAADLYRTCRRNGETVRALADCLIAIPAIRADIPVLHADRDFDAIARHSPLRIA